MVLLTPHQRRGKPYSNLQNNIGVLAQDNGMKIRGYRCSKTMHLKDKSLATFPVHIR